MAKKIKEVKKVVKTEDGEVYASDNTVVDLPEQEETSSRFRSVYANDDTFLFNDRGSIGLDW